MLGMIVTSLKVLSFDKKGVTAVEYGMIAALIAAVIVGTVSSLGTSIKGALGTVLSSL